MIKYSVIIPTYNEEKNIGKVLSEIPREIWRNGEIIVVDASSDRTAEIAKRYGAKVLKAKFKGKGYQIKVGAKYAKGDVLIFMDGDGEHPPKYITLGLKFLEKTNSNVVIFTTAPYFYKGFQKLACIIATFIVSVPFLLLNISLHDPLSGFRIMPREIWEKLEIQSNDYLIEAEMNLKIKWYNLKVKEMPIKFNTPPSKIRKSRFWWTFSWLKVYVFVLSSLVSRYLNYIIGQLR